MLRLEPAERAQALVSRWATALVPGGRAVVIDALAEGSPIAERTRALYAVNLALRSSAGEGEVHRPVAVRGFLEQAGLKVETMIESQLERVRVARGDRRPPVAEPALGKRRKQAPRRRRL